MPQPDPHDPGVEEARARAATLPPAAEPIPVEDGQVRVGTASWTDPTMTAAGVFYPEGATSAEERLRHYARSFPLVEVDATYYALPAEPMARRWVERTPAHFRFDVKAHALMTGQPTETRRLPRPIRDELPAELASRPRLYARDLPRELLDEIWRMFREGIAPLHQAGRLGAVLLQFPRWVFPSNETREAILEARARLGYPVAVEFRHNSWFNPKNAERTLRFLEDNRLPLVMVDEPQGFKSSVPPVVAVTSPELAIVRFHGRRRDLWERPNVVPSERFRYLYDEDELAEWAPAVRDSARQTRETHVIMNNCYANYGTTNAIEMAQLVRELA
jgi:uncharacterized protein YecE (DUF72 family)